MLFVVLQMSMLREINQNIQLCSMNPKKFFKVVRILVHLGYHKIPRPRLLWSPTSLCFDPLVSQILIRNKFDGIMTFLHLAHEDSEKKLKDNGDKLCKVRLV